MVVKKDGRREEFNREKIRSGIRRSCVKLPISASQVDNIVDEIESALQARSVGGEVPSTDIGEIVMERLRDLSHVAYVRFAAHYREFRDPDQIELMEQELNALRAGPRRSPRLAGASQPPLLPPTVVDTPPAQAARARRGRR
jgi:transcriptional regulator NrdR